MPRVFQVLVAAVICFGLLAVLVWGWARWARKPTERGVAPTLSLVAFVLATSSFVLALGTAVYAQFIGGFSYYDSRLIRVYRIGALLSLCAVLASLGGVWRPSALRWPALVCATGMVLFWGASAMSE